MKQNYIIESGESNICVNGNFFEQDYTLAKAADGGIHIYAHDSHSRPFADSPLPHQLEIAPDDFLTYECWGKNNGMEEYMEFDTNGNGERW